MKREIMIGIGKVNNFMQTDSLGNKIVEQFQDLLRIAKDARKEIRKCLGKYLKELEKLN